MPRIRFIHWKPEEARPQIEVLRSAGYLVDSENLTPGRLRDLRTDPVDAIVIDLGRLPSQGRDVALNLRINTKTRSIPIVFVGGSQEKVEKIKELLPDAAYSQWDGVLDTIAEAIHNPPENPIVPESGMAGYSGTPLPKKLGIRQGSAVAMLGAPEDFMETLGELPQEVRFVDRPDPDCDVTLWFTRSLEEIKTGLPEISMIAGRGKFWILWPKKASGVVSDLSERDIRRAGLDAGLVDFKIAAIDRVWSGLCFTLRKDGSS